MKRHLGYILIALVISACGSFRDGDFTNSNSSTGDGGMCIQIYRPVVCEADQYKSGAPLSQIISASGYNDCDGEKKFRAKAKSLGFNPDLLDMQCDTDPAWRI
jgi:hypothetical protein